MALPPIQQRNRERDQSILDAARRILLGEGYYALTMDRVSLEADVPKGTVYQRFGCKEDVVVALAQRGWERRLAMMRRALHFDGRPREQLNAMGEASVLSARLNPNDSRIMHMATGPILEKASEERLAAMVQVEGELVNIVRGILVRALEMGDLRPQGNASIDQIAFGLWSLMDGGYTLIESRSHESAFGMKDPFYQLWRVFQVMADGYGWKPLFTEWDYEETLVRVRKEIFPEEAQQLYGRDNWYGDAK